MNLISLNSTTLTHTQKHFTPQPLGGKSNGKRSHLLHSQWVEIPPVQKKRERVEVRGRGRECASEKGQCGQKDMTFCLPLRQVSGNLFHYNYFPQLDILVWSTSTAAAAAAEAPPFLQFSRAKENCRATKQDKVFKQAIPFWLQLQPSLSHTHSFSQSSCANSTHLQRFSSVVVNCYPHRNSGGSFLLILVYVLLPQLSYVPHSHTAISFAHSNVAGMTKHKVIIIFLSA